MRKAVIYARFSSDKQTEDSIEAQVRACREYAGSHGFSLFIVRGVSPVKHLFSSSSPPAIIREIAFIVINAINSKIVTIAVRHGPVIKRLKIILPFGTNANPTPAIIGVTY